MDTKTITVLGGVSVLLIVYLGFSSPHVLVIDDDVEPIGILNKYRSLVQGASFWENQLYILESELKKEMNAPLEMAKLQKELAELAAKNQETIYQNFPQLRPSPAQQQANALRDWADAIERAEANAMLERMRVERIQSLEKKHTLLALKALVGD